MPVAVDGRRRLNPEERKKLLLVHAVENFAHRGIGRGGHTEIAETGGVSVATVFNYFNTREDLVDAVLDEIESFLLNLAEQVYREQADPVAAIKAHLGAFLQACEEHPAYIKVWLEWSASVRDETWPKYLAFQNKLLDLIAEHIETGIRSGALEMGLSPRERARWALGNAQMLVSMVFDPDGKPSGMEEMISRGFDHILGVKSRA
ncbi:TetR family transcriptional regulator [Venatoribacter cucullus]|uniref:TetR family transcriptional regulator n=1 Tax=Venatoribacter cucullus TaxID=2661630 RepID=A0A9X7YMI7_9GAMM|nr:TetR/AcrR family transcriptional regulator [Venatoribacter cucullus]QQD23550.1 TetR family transcriptional regulator [Venatoribacter cucullus]